MARWVTVPSQGLIEIPGTYMAEGEIGFQQVVL